jgi:hypothetical protein
MKLPEIKRLVETHSEAELSAAEEAIYNEQAPAIEITGEDEGEKLTHIIAARWVKDRLKAGDIDTRSALREYTQKVRNSIS